MSRKLPLLCNSKKRPLSSERNNQVESKKVKKSQSKNSIDFSAKTKTHERRKKEEINELRERDLQLLSNTTCETLKYFTGICSLHVVATRPEQAAKQLLLVLVFHENFCQGANCTFRLCETSFSLSRHVATCKDQCCRRFGCLSSKTLITHYKNCKEETCSICAIQRKIELKESALEDKNTKKAFPESASQSSATASQPSTTIRASPVTSISSHAKHSYEVTEDSRNAHYPFCPYPNHQWSLPVTNMLLAAQRNQECGGDHTNSDF